MKPIRLSGHARDQLARRGVEEEEVLSAIRSAAWQAAERGRLECRQNFTYEREWNGKFSKPSKFALSSLKRTMKLS